MERDDPKLRIWTMQKKDVYGTFQAFHTIHALFSISHMRYIDLHTKPNKHWMTANKGRKYIVHFKDAEP